MKVVNLVFILVLAASGLVTQASWSPAKLPPIVDHIQNEGNTMEVESFSELSIQRQDEYSSSNVNYTLSAPSEQQISRAKSKKWRRAHAKKTFKEENYLIQSPLLLPPTKSEINLLLRKYKGGKNKVLMARRNYNAFGRTWDEVEVLNALTMVFPSLASFFIYKAARKHLSGYCMFAVVHIMVHFPSAFTFHLYQSLNFPQGRYSLTLRRLDNSFIHISSILISFATSQCLWYPLLLLAMNAVLITRIWKDGAKPCLVGLSLNLAGFLAPLLISGRYAACLSMFTATVLPASVYLLRRFIGEHSHPLFHLLTVLPQYILLCVVRSDQPLKFCA